MNYKSRNQSNELMNNINVRVVMPPQKKPAKRRRPQSSQLQTVSPKQQILSAPQPANFLYGNPQIPMGQQNLPQGLYFSPQIPPTFDDGTQVLFNEPVADDISDITAEMSQGLQFENEIEIQRNFYEADFNRVFIEQQEEEQRAKALAQRALEDISREPSMLNEFLSENKPMIGQLGIQTEQPPFMSISAQLGTEVEPLINLTNVRGLEPSYTFKQPQSIFSLTELPLESQLQTTRQRIVEPESLFPRMTLADMITRGQSISQKAQETISQERQSKSVMSSGELSEDYSKITRKQLDEIGKRIQEDSGRKSNPIRKLNKKEKLNWIIENGYEKYL